MVSKETAVSILPITTQTQKDATPDDVVNTASLLLPTFTPAGSAGNNNLADVSDASIGLPTAVSLLPDPIATLESVEIVPTSAPFGELIIPEIEVAQSIVTYFYSRWAVGH